LLRDPVEPTRRFPKAVKNLPSNFAENPVAKVKASHTFDARNKEKGRQDDDSAYAASIGEDVVPSSTRFALRVSWTSSVA